LASSNFFEKEVAFSQMRQFKRTAQIRGLSSSKWSQLCQTSKSNQSPEILKGGSYACVLIFKPSWLPAKGKLMVLAKAFCLNKDGITFDGI
jgi:hypothetical protein